MTTPNVGWLKAVGPLLAATEHREAKKPTLSLRFLGNKLPRDAEALPVKICAQTLIGH